MDENESSSEDEAGITLNINADYARRFEHNKKRTEMMQLEEKYGKTTAKDDVDEASESDSEDDVSEDDVGELVTEDLDKEISATLQAIKSKDPRVYDPNIKFYSEITEGTGVTPKEGKDKPMFLKDYHRKNLLEGGVQEDEAPRTYVQEQAALKEDIVKAMHAEVEEVSDAAEEEEGFLVRKIPKAKTSAIAAPILDPETAARDPENFLSNFLSSRAWIPTGTTNFQALESDDEEEEQRAEVFEAAYNLRFEDPELSNQKLLSHARDAAAKYSVRREEKSGRKSIREKERAKKEEEKKKRETDRARLKKLRTEQVEQKIEKIREAAGLRGQDVDLGEWANFLEEDWDDSKFDKEMRNRFGESYYQEEGEGTDDGSTSHSRRKKPKKPKWDDDIDIKDLIPDFDDSEKPDPAIALTDDEEDGEEDKDEEGNAQMEDAPEISSKPQKAAHADAKASARRDRRLIEQLVEQSLPLDTASSSSSRFTPFRYRETSPTAFGLTPLDILAADDSQLNEFAGLKKLAAFRDPDRKKKDKKKLGKKARLREWRKSTFGDEEGPRRELVFAPEVVVGENKGDSGVGDAEGGAVREGERKKKRKRSKKGKGVAA
ncbi:Krr1-domain-containing protein [Tothia fuscella]|uniref:Krr1-domain-containing protein n=1 Tax=Tothia fuscella TaxID=1048955 RepID=A0A9P4NXT6_9PEZI|nr:Krr1-domain-containing protein [Tothia fuscella]